MNQKSINFLLMTFFLMLFAGIVFQAVADDDHHDRHGKREHVKKNHHNESHLKKVNNPVYQEQCSDCHFAYQPELLPSASWVKILGKLDDHFGDVVELDPQSKKIISDYLISNGAEKSSSKRAVKIKRSLGSQTPMRITETKYIKDKHHEITANIIDRESIGSLSNCTACHITAEDGIYDDDDVRIPE